MSNERIRTARIVRVAVDNRFYSYTRPIPERDIWLETVAIQQGRSETAQYRSGGEREVTTADVLARIADNVWPAVQYWS